MTNKTILVIDDDIDLVEIIRVTLENEGYKVIDAQSGDRGKAMARENDPDLILLDVMMGKVDEGFQVAYELRGDEATRGIPILMLTAVVDQTGFDFDPDKDGNSCRWTSSWKSRSARASWWTWSGSTCPRAFEFALSREAIC